MIKRNFFWALSIGSLLFAMEVKVFADTTAVESKNVLTPQNEENNSVKTKEVAVLRKPKSVAIVKKDKGSGGIHNEQETSPEMVTLVDKFLGSEIKLILLNPERAESFRLAPEQDDSFPANQTLGGL